MSEAESRKAGGSTVTDQIHAISCVPWVSLGYILRVPAHVADKEEEQTSQAKWYPTPTNGERGTGTRRQPSSEEQTPGYHTTCYVT